MSVFSKLQKKNVLVRIFPLKKLEILFSRKFSSRNFLDKTPIFRPEKNLGQKHQPTYLIVTWAPILQTTCAT